MAEAHAGEVIRFEHPGAGRRRAKSTPKGRAVSIQASEEVAALLGDRPRQRDCLIEYLHLIQDTYHQISAAHLAALADEMRLAFAEVYETATFYAHFDVVKESDPPLAPLVVRVCDSVTCAMFGAERLLTGTEDAACDAGGRGDRACRARAMRRAVRSGAGGRSRTPFPPSRRSRCGGRRGRARRFASAYPRRHNRLRRLCRGRRLSAAAQSPFRRDQRRRRCCPRSMTAVCAAWAAPGSQPAANGARCSASPDRG